MSAPDELPDDGATQAAELALGLLEGPERAAALRRLLAEPGFAAEVDAWRAHFALLLPVLPGRAAPETVLERVEAALDGRGAAPAGIWRGWQWLAGAATLVAATLAGVLVLRPAPAPVVIAQAPAPLPILAAAIVSTDGEAPAVAAVYEPGRDLLRVAGTVPTDAGHSPELWVIAADKLPVSLGVIGAGPNDVTIARLHKRRFVAGSQLVITAEARGGSPDGKPHGPAIGAGALAKI
ncbi:MAG: hypothetical protein A4S16_07570 [Proteobacteria bacterium SG_bin6]|nr:MAG: hypothetical protein A4S16_07570 [Proteobacteria bacterium SG_bin6]